MQASIPLTLSVGIVLTASLALGQNRFIVESSPLVGLPEYGVTLSGDPNTPVITNSSSRRILGFVLQFEDASGRRVTRRILSLLQSRTRQNAGIPPGTQQMFSATTQVRFPRTPESGFAKVTVDAVLFDDGEFVGADTSNAFDAVSARIRAEQDLHGELLRAREGTQAQQDAVWDRISALRQPPATSPPTTEAQMVYQNVQREAARELINVREKSGENAALELATKSSVYPTIWRKR